MSKPTGMTLHTMEEKRLLIPPASCLPISLASLTFAPMTKSRYMAFITIVKGVTALMAERASGAINCPTIMASVMTASCETTAVRIDAVI